MCYNTPHTQIPSHPPPPPPPQTHTYRDSHSVTPRTASDNVMYDESLLQTETYTIDALSYYYIHL